jgi:hypothetical protein
MSFPSEQPDPPPACPRVTATLMGAAAGAIGGWGMVHGWDQITLWTTPVMAPLGSFPLVPTLMSGLLGALWGLAIGTWRSLILAGLLAAALGVLWMLVGREPVDSCLVLGVIAGVAGFLLAAIMMVVQYMARSLPGRRWLAPVLGVLVPGLAALALTLPFKMPTERVEVALAVDRQARALGRVDYEIEVVDADTGPVGTARLHYIDRPVEVCELEGTELSCTPAGS